MEREKKNVGAKQYDYQRFMVRYGIKKEVLDEHLIKMMDLIENHLSKAQKNCKGSTCEGIRLRLQWFADFIMDELWEYIQEKGLPVKVVDLEVKEEPVKDKVETLIEQSYQNGIKEFTSTQLLEFGVDKKLLIERWLAIGPYKLVRALMTNHWQVFLGAHKDGKGGDHSSNMEEL